MANNVWPVNAVSGAPSYAGRALRQMSVSPFTAIPSPSRPLGALSGVRVGTPTSVASATATTWTCGVHAGVLDVQTATAAGAYAYSVDANVSGAITAADGTNPRVDLVYVQLSDPSEGDGTVAPGIAVRYLAGAPAASPAPPATPARSLALFTIAVPRSGGGAPSVAWVAPRSVGGTPEFQTRAQLLALWASAPLDSEARVQADGTPIYNGRYVKTSSGWVRRGIAWQAADWSATSSIVQPGGVIETAAWTFTAPTDGVVRVSAGQRFFLATATYAGYVEITVDNVLIAAQRFHNEGTIRDIRVAITQDANVTAGAHTVKVRVVADPLSEAYEVWNNGLSASLTI